ncbi:50S ribosomal protein L24e [Candidatus Woesearchaeota archaeon]|nr:50S ribosomal protein L24e [Candidatus Woesearchaeota archaeon]
MRNCSYCGEEIENGTGMMFVKKDGRVLNFCSSKCEKSTLKLKRQAKNYVWTSEGRKEKQQRIKLLKQQKNNA